VLLQALLQELQVVDALTELGSDAAPTKRNRYRTHELGDLFVRDGDFSRLDDDGDDFPFELVSLGGSRDVRRSRVVHGLPVHRDSFR